MMKSTLYNPELLRNDYLFLANKIQSVVDNDKKRQIPVFSKVSSDFVYSFAKSLVDNPGKSVSIAITGESAAGKSTFVRTIASEIERIQDEFDKNILTFVSADNYFNDISQEIQKYGSFDAFLETGYNPDAPESFQLSLMRKNLESLLDGNDIKIPEYKVNGSGISVPDAIPVKASSIILSEGIAVLYPEIRDIFDVRIYVDTEAALRMERYIKRGVEKRHQTPESALSQLEKINKSADMYLRPAKKHAHIIVNGHASKDDFRAITAEIFDTVYSSHRQTLSFLRMR